MMRIADHLTLQPGVRFTDPATASNEAVRESFVLTPEAGDACSRLLQRVVAFPSPQAGPFLLAGKRGVGKTHLMRYLAFLLEIPGDRSWEALSARIGGSVRPDRPLRSLFIPVPADPGTDLGRHLIAALGGKLTPVPEPAFGEVPEEEFVAELLRCTSQLESESVALVILDNVSLRLDRVSEPEMLEHETRLYRTLIDALSRSGIVLVLVAEERHVRHEPGAAPGTAQLQSVGQACDIISLTPGNIGQVFASAVVTKTQQQKASIRAVLERLRLKLPSFAPNEDTFVSLYPIHPSVFDAAFPLRSILPGFSILHFARERIPGFLERPDDDLVTLDFLFDAILPELGKLGRFNALIASYQSFRTSVLPAFKPQVQPRIDSLLKGIAFSTVCETQAADVRTLANSLLLYEDSDFLPSYSITSALLAEMEQRGGMHLVAEGRMFDRKYRLLDLANTPSLPASLENLERETDFRRILPVLICDWIRREIPAWRFDLDSIYQRSSQSLVAALPEGDGTQGLVCFKSVYDPVWSKEDIQAFEECRYAWALLILSPLERMEELGPKLHEFASYSGRILVWLPDQPSRHEVDRLHEIVSRRTTAQPKDLTGESRDEAHQILRAVYVDRGCLAIGEDWWAIREKIGTSSLSSYLSFQLAGSIPQKVSAEAGAAKAEPTVLDTGREAIRRARMLANLSEGEGNDEAPVRNDLMAWWRSILTAEPAALTGKSELPDDLLTTQFRNETRQAGQDLQKLKPIIESLGNEEIPLSVAMEEVLRVFGGDESRITAWRDSMEKLAGLMRWLPDFQTARDYLLEAFPLGREKLDQQRTSLIKAVSQPHLFIQPSEREKFDQGFREYKEGYIDCYYAVHEEALHIMGTAEEAESKVDGKAMHNLELLSNLLYTDKSYLNRVRIMGNWILRNQCLLPARGILEHYPRCYCNFNPAGNRELADSAERINTMIREGIEYFRSVLRRFSQIIISDIKALKVDDFYAAQIASLLSRGSVESLKPRTIEILNRIIERHSTDFIIALRSQPQARRESTAPSTPLPRQ